MNAVELCICHGLEVRELARGGIRQGTAAGFDSFDLHDRTDPPVGGRVHPEALAFALTALADEVRRDSPAGGVLLTVDELQVAAATDLPLIAVTLHRLEVDHPTAAVAFAGTGRPPLPAVLCDAGVTHSDRLLLLEELPPVLTPAEALHAVIEPARQAGVRWEPDAAQLVQRTNGYPAHLQLFADETWRAAVGPDLITTAGVTTGAGRAFGRLVRQALGPRLNNLPARHLEHLTALAVHDGRDTTKQLAATLGRTHEELSWIRDALIRNGDIYSPARGHLITAVPALAGFLLNHYDTARDHTDIELLPLARLQHNASLVTRADIGSGPPPSPRS